MFDVDRWPNWFLYATTKLRVSNPSKNESSEGTGFYFRWTQNGREYRCLITNRHVVTNRERDFYEWCFDLRTGTLDVQSGPGNLVRGYSERRAVSSHTPDSPPWIVWPDDGDQFEGPEEDYDLAALVLDDALSALPSGTEPQIKWLDDTMLPSERQLEELAAVEDVLMPGYPFGYIDEVNNFPIVRTGSTASHPWVDYNGFPCALLNVPAFQKASGSPVILNKPESPLLLGVYSKGFPALAGTAAFHEVLDAPEHQEIMGLIHKQMELLRVPIDLGVYVKSRGLRAITQQVERFIGAGRSDRALDEYFERYPNSVVRPDTPASS